ncbi:MAG TPA: type II secretion system protein [Azospira sp.]|nr:type II secretion system protein [Azospira sp.]
MNTPAHRGFTLIELVVSLALVALFATIALPLAELTVKRGKETELRLALRQIREALDAYKQAVDEGRILISPGDTGYPKQLILLVEETKDARTQGGTPLRFLRRIPRDPFADPKLRPEETWGLRSYRSPYDRPQAGEDVYDVYSQSPDSGINGIPYREW